METLEPIPVFATEEMLEAGMDALRSPLPPELAGVSQDAKDIARALLVYTMMVHAAPADLRPRAVDFDCAGAMH
jgi:hypothetical protein